MPGRSATTERITPKQQAYIEYRSQGKDVAEAANAAGYKGHATLDAFYSMEAKPHFQLALARARTSYSSKAAWDIEWWRTKLGRAMQAAENASDLPSQLRALELAGRHLGALEPTAPISPAAQTLLTMLAESMQRAQLPAPKVIELVTENKVVTGAEEKS